MVKAIKITPCGFDMIDNYRSDPDYVDNMISGYSSVLPQFWKHNQYRLSVFMLDTMEDKDEFNYLATCVYRKLKSPYGEVKDVIRGFMFICNEREEEAGDEDKDREGEIDFTETDFTYILEKMQDIKYLKKHEQIDWKKYQEEP